jgi:hypothetical protein
MSAQGGYVSIISQGLYNVEETFTSAITTTSTTDVVMTGMTITPPAGTYFVSFVTWVTNTTGNSQATVSIYSGGVQKASSVVKGAPFTGAVGGANDGMPLATHGIVTVNGSQAIAIEWHTASGTLSAANGTLDILKIG